MNQYVTDNTAFLKAALDTLYSGTNTTATSELSTASTASVNGQCEVTVTVGTSGLCLVGFNTAFRNSLAGGRMSVGYDFFGASVGGMGTGREIAGQKSTVFVRQSHVNLEVGINPGATTFRMRFFSFGGGNVAYIGSRVIWALPI